MSDRLAAVLALTASLAAAPVAMAADCAMLSRHFAFCPQDGSAWADAEWEQFGDGAALHLGSLTLDFTENWAARGHEATPAAALDAMLARMLSDERHQDHVAATLTTATLKVALRVQTITFSGDAPIVRASMIAEGGGHRIMLLLTGPDKTPPADIEAAARDMVALISPAAKEG